MNNDPITSEAVLRMATDGLSEDEIAIALPQLPRSEIRRILFADKAEHRKKQRVQETLDRMMGPWSIR